MVVTCTGLLQRLLLLRLLCLPCTLLFGHGNAVVLQARGTATRTAASPESDSPQLVSSGQQDAAVRPVDLAGPEDDEHVEEQRLEEQTTQACASNLTLMHISPVPTADLPCLPIDSQLKDASDAAASGRRLALFVLEDENGSAKMRGELMAAAFSTFAGWHGFFVHKVIDIYRGNFSYQPALSSNLRVDLCVLVKFPIDGLHVCKEQKAQVIYWDVLDSPLVPKMLQTPPGQTPPDLSLIPSGIDILLSPDAQFSEILNSHLPPRFTGRMAGMPRSFPLYHSHTNSLVVSPVSRFALPYVCRVAIFVSDHRHSPSKTDQLRMQQSVCEAPHVWSFAILTQLQEGSRGPIVNSTLHDHWCPNRPQEMHDACLAADESTKQQHEEEFRDEKSEKEVKLCRTDQSKYHKDVHNRMVDVAIVAAESKEPAALHRPSTRVITWMSYGVPVLYTSGYAYDEVADEWDYTLPGLIAHSRLYMSFPRTPWPPFLATHLEKLSNNGTRMGMREKGLDIASQFTTRAVAARLQAHFEKTLC